MQFLKNNIKFFHRNICILHIHRKNLVSLEIALVNYL